MFVIRALNFAQKSLSLLEHNLKSHKIYWGYNPTDFVCIGYYLFHRLANTHIEQFPSCALRTLVNICLIVIFMNDIFTHHRTRVKNLITRIKIY